MTTSTIPPALERRWRHMSRRADRLHREPATPRRRRLVLRARLLEMRAWNAVAPYWRPGTTLRAWEPADFAAVRTELEGLAL